MNIVDKAIETQLKNIQAKTGKTLDELRAVMQQSALTKHGEIRAMFQRDLGLGYGDANMLAQVLRDTAGERLTAAPTAPPDELVNTLYAGAKAALRPIHDQLMAGIEQLGAYEIAPKKGYLSLRRSKQFAMIGPATNTRVEVGLNMKGGAATERLAEMPSGSMCNYKVKLTDVAEVDAELMAWIKRAYESLTLIEGSLAYMRNTAAHEPPGSVTHHHGEQDHMTFLERPFHEAAALLHQRMHKLGIAH